MSFPHRRLVSALMLLGAATSTLGAQNNPQASQPDENRVVKANWALANRFSAAATRSITYTFGVQPRFLGKSDTMYYNWRDRNGSRFMLYVPSPSGGTKRPLFDVSKLAEQLTLLSKKPYDATNLPFQTITFLKNHKAFRFTTDSTRYEWTLATEQLKSLGRVVRNAPPPDDEERETGGGFGGGGGGGGGFGGGGGREFRNFSPDSTVFVFARDHNLFLVDVKKADTTKISNDGVEDSSFGARDTTENRRQLNALSGGGGQNQGDDDEQDDVNSREMRVRANVIWSPDSKSFAIVRRDQRKVKDLFLVNVLANPRPVLLHYKYTMPGEENVTQSELWVYRRGDAAVKQINVRKWKDQSIQDVHWPISGDKLRIVRRDRPQRTVDFIEIDLASGGIKTLLADAIEGAALEPKPVRYLKKGGDFLWWSQKTGWGMFYVYGFDGGEKMPLTTGQWNVNSLVKIDSTTQQVWVSGQGREPGEQLYQTHLYRVNGNGTGLMLLDAGDAHHALTLGENGTPSVVSPSGRYVYDTYSKMDQAPVSVVRDGLTGRVLTKLEEMDLSKLTEVGFKFREHVYREGGGRRDGTVRQHVEAVRFRQHEEVPGHHLRVPGSADGSVHDRLQRSHAAHAARAAGLHRGGSRPPRRLAAAFTRVPPLRVWQPSRLRARRQEVGARAARGAPCVHGHRQGRYLRPLGWWLHDGGRHAAAAVQRVLQGGLVGIGQPRQQHLQPELE
ncbi:MAG: hypothetical protein HEQ11_14060 [Gemmatimonas sp.]